MPVIEKIQGSDSLIPIKVNRGGHRSYFHLTISVMLSIFYGQPFAQINSTIPTQEVQMRDRIEEALWNHGENSWEHLEAIGNLVNAYSKIPLKNEALKIRFVPDEGRPAKISALSTWSSA